MTRNLGQQDKRAFARTPPSTIVTYASQVYFIGANEREWYINPGLLTFAS